MNKKKGFTMVELLVVLVIIGILAAVATPIFLANTKRAKASEAVAAMSLLRQAMRDYRINSNLYFDIAVNTTDGNIQNSLPTSVNATTLAPTPATAGVDVDVEVTQYFSNHAFSLNAGSASTPPTSARFTSPPAKDFIVVVNGGDSVACSSTVLTNCAIKAAEIANYDLEMDNSGRIFVSYDNGTSWSPY